MKPSPLWGPALDKNRKRYLASLHEDNEVKFEVVESLTSKQDNGHIEKSPLEEKVNTHV